MTSGWNGGNEFNLTLQDNVILNPTTTPISIQDAGPLMLLDNVVRYTKGPVVVAGCGGYVSDIISVGNTYCVSNPFSYYGTCRITELDDVTVSAGSINETQPTLPTDPLVSPPVIEVAKGANGAAIQTAINTAYADYNGEDPVVHIPAGVHTVTSTITIPANCDVQLVGDGQQVTQLTWTSSKTDHGSILLMLDGPSQATVEDLEINANGNCDRGMVVEEADVTGDRVDMDQIGSYNQGTSIAASVWAGILVYGQVNSVLNIDTMELNYGGGQTVQQCRPTHQLERPVSVYGNSAFGSPYTGGHIQRFLGSISGRYGVYNNGNLIVQDSWYETHPLIDFRSSWT